MECREKCGACCIMPSISSSIPGMPNGKPAGLPCIHLMEDYKCDIYTSKEKPLVCGNFKADELICGQSREEALKIMADLEWYQIIGNQ